MLPLIFVKIKTYTQKVVKASWSTEELSQGCCQMDRLSWRDGKTTTNTQFIYISIKEAEQYSLSYNASHSPPKVHESDHMYLQLVCSRAGGECLAFIGCSTQILAWFMGHGIGMWRAGTCSGMRGLRSGPELCVAMVDKRELLAYWWTPMDINVRCINRWVGGNV